MPGKKIVVTKDQLEWAMTQTNSVHAAASVLGIAYTTFIRRCKEHGVYKPNQGLQGTNKPRAETSTLEKIFSNEVFAKGSDIKTKMLKAGLINDECSICKLPPVWKGKKLVMQMDHIDGDRTNNSQSNLRLLCPNCHAQTHTFSRGKFRSQHAVVAELVDAQA